MSEPASNAEELSKALFEMRDNLVRLSLALKDALFEAHLRSQSSDTDSTPSHSDLDERSRP